MKPLAVCSIALIFSLQLFWHAANCMENAVPTRDAKLLASKSLLSNYAVEKKEFVVNYCIYNVGDKSALSVTLNDRNFPPEYYEVVKGLISVTWNKIAPGTNVSNSVILRPIYYGPVNYTSAEVTYLPSDTSDKLRVCYTTSSGEGYVYKLRDYERKFASRYLDWLLFGAMLMPTILLPLLLWAKSKNKYDLLMAKEPKNLKKD